MEQQYNRMSDVGALRVRADPGWTRVRNLEQAGLVLVYEAN